MSTPGTIARLSGLAPLHFYGRYHHWESYPSGLGRALRSLYHGHFQCDLGALLRVLLDEHPAGWSSIVGADFDLLPATEGGAAASQEHLPPGASQGFMPVCYCHGYGERTEPDWEVTQANASWSGCEWAYAFVTAPRPEHEVMLVLSSYLRSGQKMVGSFGEGDSAALWAIVALVALNGAEPDWEGLDATGLSPLLGANVDAGREGGVQRDDRPRTYAVRLAEGALHYVGVRRTREGTTFYCTCSPDEEAPCPDCPHSLAVRSYREMEREQARLRREGGVAYSGGASLADGQGTPAAFVWHGAEPQILLPHRNYARRYGLERDGDTLSLPLALAILHDFCGDEELAMACCREFDRHLLLPVVSQDCWELGAGDIETFLEGRDISP